MALPVLSAASKNFMSEVTFTLIFAKALAWQFEALLTGDIICFFCSRAKRAKQALILCCDGLLLYILTSIWVLRTPIAG